MDNQGQSSCQMLGFTLIHSNHGNMFSFINAAVYNAFNQLHHLFIIKHFNEPQYFDKRPVNNST